MIWFIIISILISIANVNTLVPIGANMPGLADFGHSQPYVNLVKQTRQWGSASAPWDANTTVDPITGWPTADFGGIFLSGSVDAGGQYLLYAKGNAEVTRNGDPHAYISNKTYDPATNTLSAVVNIPQNAASILLNFRNTTGPGLQDIVLLQPGYNLTAKSNITNVMLAHLSRFSLLRFMDWTGTNGNPEVNWNDTTPVNYARYTDPKRNPWQTIPFIANQVDNIKPIDIWINIPVNASDDYILNVARIMFNDLNPRSKIYLEYSNELWNWGFSQYHVNVDLANDSVLHHGDPHHLNYDNRSGAYTWATRRTAYQIKHIGDLFRTVFGDENVGQWKRVRPILAGFTVGPNVIQTGLDYLNAVFGPPSTLIHGIAIAPYFDLGPFSTWTNLTTDQVLDGLNTSMQQFLPEQGWSQLAPLAANGIYAAWYKLPVYGYEGGPATSGCENCSLDAKINATRHPRMTDICVSFLNGWYQHGFQEINWYSGGAGGISRYGSWNLLEDMRQETLIDTTSMFNATSSVAQLPRPAPKLKAIDQVRQSSIELNFGIPIPSYNFNATNYMGHQVPYPWPVIAHLAANNTFYYPLKIVESPMRINVTVYTSENAGLLEGSLNNEQYIQVLTPNTGNHTIFQPAPVMQFNINQTILPSIVAFRLKNTQNGYNIRSIDFVPSTTK